MTEHANVADHYCAQRDSLGNVRLDCGHGVLVVVAGEDPEVTHVRASHGAGGFNAPEWASVLRLLADEASMDSERES